MSEITQVESKPSQDTSTDVTFLRLIIAFIVLAIATIVGAVVFEQYKPTRVRACYADALDNYLKDPESASLVAWDSSGTSITVRAQNSFGAFGRVHILCNGGRVAKIKD